MLTLDELVELSKQNFARAVSYSAAIDEILKTSIPDPLPENYTITFSAYELRDLRQLLLSLKYCIAQCGDINSGLLTNFSTSLINQQYCIADAATTPDEKIKLLERLLSNAIDFLPKDFKDYIEAKKNRIVK